jgi:hypothetical protein
MGQTNGLGRRGLLLALASGTAVQGQTVTVAPWRAVGEAYGVKIPEERWGVLAAVLERRRAQLEVLRRFRVAEGVEPSGTAEGDDRQ